MSATSRYTLEEITVIKNRHEKSILKLPNVIGVGIGLENPDSPTPDEEELSIIITVKEPTAPNALPTELEGVPVRILNVGTLRGLE